MDEVGELDLGHRHQAVDRRADGHADDARLRQRRVEHARLAVLGVETRGGQEDAALLAHVLAQHPHPLVPGHLLVECLAYSLD